MLSQIFPAPFQQCNLHFYWQQCLASHPHIQYQSITSILSDTSHWLQAQVQCNTVQVQYSTVQCSVCRTGFICDYALEETKQPQPVIHMIRMLRIFTVATVGQSYVTRVSWAPYRIRQGLTCILPKPVAVDLHTGCSSKAHALVPTARH